MKGILLLALGHPNWGRWAVNLAMSLKYASPDIKISIAYAGNGINQVQGFGKGLFDKILKVPEKYYMKEGRVEYLKAKLALPRITPYKETLYLDSDMIWLPKHKPEELFLDVDFAIANRGSMNLEGDLTDDFGVWASPKEIKKTFRFKEGKFYNLSSEVVFFKSTKEVKKLYDDALKIYDRNDYDYRMFNHAIPDELPLTISMIKNQLYPHKDNWKPIYWESAEHKHLKDGELLAYHAYSMGGAYTEKRMKDIYNNFVQFYCNQYKQRYPNKWIDKVSWMPGRHNL